MKTRICILLFTFSITLAFSQTAPPLIWHQDYGAPEYAEIVTAAAIDDADNFYVAGTVYFGAYGNIIVNKYDPFGNLLWNRMYSNNYNSPFPDKPVLLHPDGNGGTIVLGYVNRAYTLGHLYTYDVNGNVSSDYFFGDTTLGNTIPLEAGTNDGSHYFLLGALNGVSKAFKIDSAGDVLWSQPLHNDHNPNSAGFAFDPAGNVVAGVFDSATANVMIRRFASGSGAPLSSFNTLVDSVVEDSLIHIQVDNGNNVLLAGTGTDSTGNLQLKVYKFDSTGTQLWSVMCNSQRGYYTNHGTRLRLDNNGDVLIDGDYNDRNDSLQFIGLFKISSLTGTVEWSVIDTGNVVTGGALKIDGFNQAYLGTLKGNSIAYGYTLLNFTCYSADSGAIVWNRSFDNGEDNIYIQDVQNNAGDLFIACTTLLDSLGNWFLARVGNAANDVQGISQISKDENSLMVYPNPFHASTHIAFTVQQSQKMQFSVFDITGKVLSKRSLQANAGYNMSTFEGPLSPGVYIFRLEGPGAALVEKVVVN